MRPTVTEVARSSVVVCVCRAYGCAVQNTVNRSSASLGHTRVDPRNLVLDGVWIPPPQKKNKRQRALLSRHVTGHCKESRYGLAQK